jgi:hypothetical protein
MNFTEYLSNNNMNFTEYLSNSPSKKDLYRFSNIKLKKKRARKKFEKNCYRYVSAKIYNEYLAKIMCMPIMRSLNYAELGKKLVMVEQL